ncbi:Transmembrane GTPase fzo1 [Leucoagaricus sp. SymC.cos]|nr:Transmembrane GTPase fzo1 [Leucoagaricus sp. SymC.cos]
MAQSYFPSRALSPAKVEQTDFAMHADRQLRVGDVQEAFVQQKDRLLTAIDSTKTVLSDIRAFNKDKWVVRYPQLRDYDDDSLSAPPKRRSMPRRSLSFADDPSFQADVVVSPHNGMNRRITLTSIQDVQDEKSSEPSSPTKHADDERLIPSAEFNVLKLDLKLGSHSSSTAASLVHQLEKSSIANLLDDRIGASMSHIDKLRLRVEDTSSKVLVTGDLNAGKSTFVNALLRREVMPVDQQPCTTAFCEVHDAAENDGKEEVHVLKEGVEYNIRDESTYVKGTIADLEGIVADNEVQQQMIKVYLADTRAPSESLLNNGIVDISLIDAPGLNRDSLKTTAVFARQEEIDVVVFVVSAENHFTLSAKEFLWNASNEKAYLFIVVNKYDQIRNKEKCRRLVLEQIKQLSPRTYEDAEDLVHFVDSATALQPYTANPAFDDLESALRSFVLVKRSKSKLQPVTTYLQNILSDVELLSSANAIVANSELAKARDDLSHSRPILEKLKSSREELETSLENTEEDSTSLASNKTKAILVSALDRVGQGHLGVTNSPIPLPSYPGLMGIWKYTRGVRKALLASLDHAVKLAEDEARLITSEGVDKIRALEDEHLPTGMEKSKRVFVPEAMFSTFRRNARGGRRRNTNGGAIVAGGTQGLGIGLASRPELLETTFFDIFDVNHQFLIYFPNHKSSSSSLFLSSSPYDDIDDDLDKGPSPTALSILSLSLGAITMVGGQAIGARGLIEGILRLGDLLSNESSRKWLGPVLGVTTIGLGVYLVFELPSNIPRTIGRRVRSQVLRSHHSEQQQRKRISTYVDGVQLSSSSSLTVTTRGSGFIDPHAERVSKETRKVLKIASWQLREKFRDALEERQKEVKGSEDMERRAESALKWFEDVGRKADEIRGSVQSGEEVGSA